MTGLHCVSINEQSIFGIVNTILTKVYDIFKILIIKLQLCCNFVSKQN